MKVEDLSSPFGKQSNSQEKGDVDAVQTAPVSIEFDAPFDKTHTKQRKV